MKKRRTSKSDRQIQVARGRRAVMAAVGAGIAFYLAFLTTSLTGERFGPPSDNLVAAGILAACCAAASYLAVAAYLTHTLPRQFFVLLNFAGAVAGIVWIGFQIVRAADLNWIVLDGAGVVVAIAICWVFSCHQPARRFFEQQEFHVKRD